MRVVIDLQSAQGDSRYRGIGRYSVSLAKAMIRFHPEHQYIIVLNGMLTDSIESIRAEFDEILCQDCIQVWNSVGPVRPAELGNENRRFAAEIAREYFIASLQPDIVHITTLFEGYSDSAVSSVGRSKISIPTAVTFYDLIPLIERNIYLTPHPRFERYYQDRLDNLKRIDIYLSISESAGQELVDHLGTVPGKIVNIGAGLDEKFKPIELSADSVHALKRRFRLRGKFLMYSGATDERKNHLRLIEAYSMLPSWVRRSHQLCLVGRLPSDHKTKFIDHARSFGLSPDDVLVTEEVTDFELVALYNLCELFVFPSWHEGFGLPALEAMACGAPVIGSNTTSVPEVIGRIDALFNPFDSHAIAAKILEVLEKPHLRTALIQQGSLQAKKFTWKNCANKAIAAFESHRKARAEKSGRSTVHEINYLPSVISELSDHGALPTTTAGMVLLAESLAKNHPLPQVRQLLIDVSELVHRDSRSGIQRVVRSIIFELLNNPPQNMSVRLVYAPPGNPGYRYANTYTARNFEFEGASQDDSRIEFRAGDVFLGLDLQHHIVLQNEEYYQVLRNSGVSVYFVVYDLLPILAPTHFRAGIKNDHERWLDVLCRTDGLISISRSVSDELLNWLQIYGQSRRLPLKLGWFHLGADVSESIPTAGIPENAGYVFSQIRKRPTFLMVGTVESRKGHTQVYDAFQKLWSSGRDLNLIIVGQRGWHVDSLVEQLTSSPENGNRLFWLDGISDEYLERIYESSTCLLAASEGEGFGLPLIEAAQKKIPIVARDIPVFREVAGDNAYYFSGSSSEDLAADLLCWLKLWNDGAHPSSNGLKWSTWKQSAQALVSVFLGENWHVDWMPENNVLSLKGDDARLSTPVGKRVDGGVQSTESEGHLLFGPYAALASGQYKVVLRGSFDDPEPFGCHMDVAISRGAAVLARSELMLQSNSTVAELQFTLEQSCIDLEVRLWVSKSAKVFVNRIYIHSC